ncbi:MAG: DUF1990 domain-containing protein [Myxococcales bacterium]|nr:DUF1990 domain-containing protein [Myxococcales bacterium]
MAEVALAIRLMFYLRAPTDEQVLALLRDRAHQAFTYEDVGITRGSLEAAPSGFTLDRYGVELGRGQAVFERARAALRRIDNYPPSFTRVVRSPGDLAPGFTFATLASHLGFHSVHPCRVIHVIDVSDCFAFCFGTLPGHAESGEERFEVSIESDVVRYDVQAFSRPISLMSRIGAPIARALQVRFQRETLDVMRAHAG